MENPKSHGFLFKVFITHSHEARGTLCVVASERALCVHLVKRESTAVQECVYKQVVLNFGGKRKLPEEMKRIGPHIRQV